MSTDCFSKEEIWDAMVRAFTELEGPGRGIYVGTPKYPWLESKSLANKGSHSFGMGLHLLEMSRRAKEDYPLWIARLRGETLQSSDAVELRAMQILLSQG